MARASTDNSIKYFACYEESPINRFKVIKQKIKRISSEKTERSTVASLDGIVHKIPYGKCVSKDIKKSKSGFGLKYHTETACSSDYDVNCGRKEFDFVCKILKNSGFSGHGVPWSLLPFQPLDPVMFDEEYGLAQETGISGIEHGKFLEQMLLFDLINEVLVEVFEDSFGYVLPWFVFF
ncbi:hypothetical protein HPP92_018581 [Vanilla planifolia]|uniref:DUF4378 domain-containing protein n=1 Tax=Vanilla planifolia TaxID=51239 RepID=A0A835UPN3_VANPL|nr:hypothetical protein HPP92_018581 [Vanilla planifolia]